MAQYIDKDALVAEIEKRRRDWNYGSSIEAKYKREECDDILSLIDTFEVKEVNLWTELDNYIEHYRNRETGYTMFGIAKHFFELGLKAQKGK